MALTIDKTDCYTRRVMMCAVTSSTCVCFAVANFSFHYVNSTEGCGIKSLNLIWSLVTY